MSALDAFDAMSIDEKLRAAAWLESNGCGEYVVALRQAWERRVRIRVNGANAARADDDAASLPGPGSDSLLTRIFDRAGSDELDRRMFERAERTRAERREDFARDNRIPLRDLRG